MTDWDPMPIKKWPFITPMIGRPAMTDTLKPLTLEDFAKLEITYGGVPEGSGIPALLADWRRLRAEVERLKAARDAIMEDRDAEYARAESVRRERDEFNAEAVTLRAERDEAREKLEGSQRALLDQGDAHRKAAGQCIRKGEEYKALAREAAGLLAWIGENECKRHDWTPNYGDEQCGECCRETTTFLAAHPELKP